MRASLAALGHLHDWYEAGSKPRDAINQAIRLLATVLGQAPDLGGSGGLAQSSGRQPGDLEQQPVDRGLPGSSIDRPPPGSLEEGLEEVLDGKEADEEEEEEVEETAEEARAAAAKRMKLLDESAESLREGLEDVSRRREFEEAGFVDGGPPPAAAAATPPLQHALTDGVGPGLPLAKPTKAEAAAAKAAAKKAAAKPTTKSR